MRRVKQLLGPNLIVSPSHEALLPNVPPENVEAMAQAARESVESSRPSRTTTETFAYGILAALVAALGGYMFGFEMAIIAGPLIFVEKCFALTTWQSECLVSSFLIGAIVGAALSGRL